MTGSIIETEHADLAGERFDWMVGDFIASIEYLEPAPWVFRFSKGGFCSVDFGTWRLSTTADGVVACSDDHGGWFGLPAPVDSREVAAAALGEARVESATVGDFAPDLVIRFEGGLVLELLALSRSYECWQAGDPLGRHVVIRGGRAASTWRV